MPTPSTKHNPGHGYKLKEPLGSGAWKTAYRGSAPGRLLDVALLCYHQSDPHNIAKDAMTLLRLTGDEKYARHVAQFINIFQGADRRVWIVEELLQHSLLEMSPLRDIGQYCSIARDLSRGLAFIHSRDLVHRDLKLDNCGVDRYGVAKIFDIGSVTTEPGKSICTILTCPPEAIEASVSGEESEAPSIVFDQAGDIWALGATLFALRVGHYPFVTMEEMQERMKLHLRLAQNKISRETYKKRKVPLDQRVRALASRRGAEDRLKEEINQYFDGGALRLLSQMLTFDSRDRPTAEALQAAWGNLAADFAKPSGKSTAGRRKPVQTAWQATLEFLQAVQRGKISATPTQIQHCIAEWERMHSDPAAGERDAKVDDLLEEVKALVEERWEKRPKTVILGAADRVSA